MPEEDQLIEELLDTINVKNREITEFECALCQPDSHKAQADCRKRRSKKNQESTIRRSQNVKSPTPHWQINIKTPNSASCFAARSCKKWLTRSLRRNATRDLSEKTAEELHASITPETRTVPQICETVLNVHGVRDTEVKVVVNDAEKTVGYSENTILT